MGEFKTIETQEELDSVIKDRLERERKSLSEKYSDYDELKKKNAEYEAQVSKLSEANKTFETKTAEYDKQINELNSKIKGYETASAKTRIALATGLPYEMAERLSGTTEEEIKKDAETLAKFMGKKEAAPTASNEPATYEKSKDEALRALVRNMSTE